MITETLFLNLLNLNKTTADIIASAIITKEGLVVTTGLPGQLDKHRVGSVSAGIFSLANRTANAFFGEELKQISIKGKNNNVLITGLGKVGILTVITNPNALIDSVFFNMQRSSEKLLPLYNALYDS